MVLKSRFPPLCADRNRQVAIAIRGRIVGRLERRTVPAEIRETIHRELNC
nr:hypothetical protein JVH1_4793 [Rhodococcus sp. JVH1]